MEDVKAAQLLRWPRLANYDAMRTVLLAATVMGLSWALLMGSVGLGTRTGSIRIFDQFRASAVLDYSSRPQAPFVPLTSAFIGRVLPGGALAQPRSGSSRAASHETPRRNRVVLEHPFDNDDFQNARDLSSLPITAKTNTTGATRQEGEPSDCSSGPLVGGTVWYRYRSHADDVLSLTTVGTKYSTSLGVFSGTSFGDLRKVACDTSESGDSWVTFAGRAGTTYYLQVTGPLGGGGDLSLSLDLHSPETSLTSVTHDGVSGDFWSDRPSISADGRYVLFLSQATNGVGDDTNDYTDVFLRDRISRTTTRVSLGESGQQGAYGAFNGLHSLSEDGRYVAFESFSPNLVPEDKRPGLEDIFVRDLVGRKTELLTVSSSGEQGSYSRAYVNDYPPAPAASISADGRFVAFHSWFLNLVPKDTNYCPDFGAQNGYQLSTTGCPDIFVRDLRAKTTTLVSVTSSTGSGPWLRCCPTIWIGGSNEGHSGNGASYVPVISSNGRFVAFYSEASDLVPNDNNESGDFFVHDINAKRTTRVSVSSSGGEAIAGSSVRIPNQPNRHWGEAPGWRSSISADGRYVAFSSMAPNLVTNDTNLSSDVFLHDRLTSTTTRVSVASSGLEGNENSFYPDISPDGRYVAFASWASNLVARDTNDLQDIFVHDRVTRTTARLSVSESGEQGNGVSSMPALSADGRFIAFSSFASNFVAWDRNEARDVFVFPLRIYR